MKESWLFQIGSDKYSTKDVSYGGDDYEARVLPESFAGGVSNRVDFSGGMFSPTDCEFELSNTDGVIGDLSGETCLISQVLDGVLNRSWNLIVESSIPYYQKVKVKCVDKITYHSDGDYPNTPNPYAKFPASEVVAEEKKKDASYSPLSENDARIPVTFGTAYIPIVAVLDADQKRYYVLGLDGSYTISEVRSPREWDFLSTWDATYTYNYYTKSGCRVAQLIIAPPGDVPKTDNGVWIRSGNIYSPLIKFTGPNVAVDGFGSLLYYMLQQFGISASDLYSSSFTAKDALATIGGGFWKAEARETLLSAILQQCDCFISHEATIKLNQFSRTSIQTFDKTKIKNLTYRPANFRKSITDGVTVRFLWSGEPQDELTGKTTVGLYSGAGTPAHPSDTFEYKYDSDNENAQKFGILWAQKKYDKKGSVSFQTTMDSLSAGVRSSIMAGKVITINDSLYGSSESVGINLIQFKPGLILEIEGSIYNHLEDITNVTATTITKPTADDSDYNFGEEDQYVIVSGEQVFKYLTGAVIPVNTTIVLTAQLFGGLVLYDWEYWNGATWVDLSGVQDAATYSLAYNNAAWGADTILTVRCASGDDYDQISIVKVSDGSGFTIVLTNETYTIPCDSTGIVKSGAFGAGSLSECSIIAFKGATQLTAIAEGGTPVDGEFKYVISDESGGNAERQDNDTFYLASASSLTGVISITVTCGSESIDILKKYTFNKTLDGADGLDGSLGLDGKTAKISATGMAFRYKTDGTLTGPATATCTASAQGITVPYYYFYLNDVHVVRPEYTVPTYTYTPQASYDDMPEKVEVLVCEGVSGDFGVSDWLARDQIDMIGLKAGSSTINVILTNEACSVPTDASGAPTSYAGTGTGIMAWIGVTRLNYDIVVPYSPNTYRINARNVTNIVAGVLSYPSVRYIYSGNCSGMNVSIDTADIEFEVIVVDENGTEYTFLKQQSFSKSKTGAVGSGVTYRGDWVAATVYVGTASVKDVVKYSGTYYICQTSHTSGVWATDLAAGKWVAFGSTFASVATDILLAQDVAITKTLSFTGGTSKILISGTNPLEVAAGGDLLFQGTALNSSIIKFATIGGQIWVYSDYGANRLLIAPQQNNVHSVVMGFAEGFGTLSSLEGQARSIEFRNSGSTVVLNIGSVSMSLTASTIIIAGTLTPSGSRNIGKTTDKFVNLYLSGTIGDGSNRIGSIFCGAINSNSTLVIAGALSGVTTLSMSSTITGVTSITISGSLLTTGTSNVGSASNPFSICHLNSRLRIYSGADIRDLMAAASSTGGAAYPTQDGWWQVRIDGLTRYIKLYRA